jgi:acetyltransferase
MKDEPDMKYLFEPQSVAVIGASHSREKIGYRILENIISGKFRGKVYPINPKGGEILGLCVYPSLADVPGKVDVAFIVVPAEDVFAAVKECAAKGVKFLPIIASGFSEIGKSAEERQIVDYARAHGMRVIGPNIFGMYSANSSLNATFGPREVRKGDVAIITQSGALGISMMGRTSVENIGLSAMVSVGNKSDIDEADLLAYLAKDESTRTILMYIEGVHDGERLVSALKSLSGRKPVIVVKAGRSKRGAIAAASHTGALAGSDRIFAGAMKQCRVLRAESIQEALSWCKFMSDSPLPAGESTVIITNGGGMGVIAADACEKYDVRLYDNVASMQQIFAKAVPVFGSFKNPIDLTGQAKIEDYENAINFALASPEIHSVICLGCETAFFDADKLSLMIERLYSSGGPAKPVVFSFFGGEKIEESIVRLSAKDIPVFSDVYSAVSCLGALHENFRNASYGQRECSVDASKMGIDSEYIRRIILKVLEGGRQSLLADEAQDVMRAAGIMVPRSRVAGSIGEAVKYAEEIRYPVVLKVVSSDIIHKSDAGGVVSHIDNKKELMDAYEAIMFNCKKHFPRAHIAGIEVSEMVAGNVEMIVGAIRDKSFGPVVMAGLGGIYVSVMDDVSFRVFPLGSEELMHMLGETKAYRLLLGVRGEERRDINSLVDTITRLGVILRKNPQISDIEINPLVVFEDGGGAKALDVRILLSKTKENEQDCNSIN